MATRASPAERTTIVFGRGSALDPAGGAHDAPPDTLVAWGGGYPLHPLSAFGASILRPYARSSHPGSCMYGLSIGIKIIDLDE